MTTHYVTVASKEQIQSAPFAIQEELDYLKLSKLRDTVAQILSSRNYSSLMSDIEDGGVFFEDIQVPEEDTVEYSIFKELEGLLPIWSVNLLGSGENLYFKYGGQYFPQPAYIEVDFRTQEIIADYSGEIGNGVPSDVFHNIRSRFYIDSSLSSESINEIMMSKSVISQFCRIFKNGEIRWDGSNNAFILNDDAPEDIYIDTEHLISELSNDKSIDSYLFDGDEDIEEQPELLEIVKKLNLDEDNSNAYDLDREVEEYFENAYSSVIYEESISSWLDGLIINSIYPEASTKAFVIENGRVFKSEKIDVEGEDYAIYLDWSGTNFTVGDLIKADDYPENLVEEVATKWLLARGFWLSDTAFLTLKELGFSVLDDMSLENGDVWQVEIPSVNTKSGIPEIIDFEPELDDLKKLEELGFAEVLDTKLDGSVKLWSINYMEFVSLPNDTVITREAYNSSEQDQSLFPYD